ncbi:TPA: Hok/Gef family protein [Enterobacter hormaechei]|nr:Hok/Gef family protein [Enterobacter hormaechei]
MKRQSPIIRVLMIVALTIIIITLVTRKTLCEIRFRNGSLEVTARMDCRSGKSGAGCGGA